MPTWADFFHQFDWAGLVTFLFTAAASLLCITLHELAHGFSAYLLGDQTAKRAGRLTLNPIRHIDVLGLLMMLTVHVGWAKPVPINMSNFRHPKRGMAITALAGPLANFLLSFAALFVGRFVWARGVNSEAGVYVLLALMYVAVLSLGLGLFNLIPISPLDGSKILLSFLPDQICYTVLRYERYVALALLLLAWLGVFSGPLNFLMGHVMRWMCVVSGFPYELMAYFFF